MSIDGEKERETKNCVQKSVYPILAELCFINCPSFSSFFSSFLPFYYRVSILSPRSI
ncbi:hypothetical protein BDW42DRAFT_160665 [Aspergillus taichungensis]|uniref:Uncharacterized protein n=1 Tax=Aspergillus taichungensis TaxID=482145 RepID=A0A2J5I6E4_9EURO|nr:hypothetical protein BDW42DRAFT_160665 [Aspergillus taichungensis]